jgi:hypothetical protein
MLSVLVGQAFPTTAQGISFEVTIGTPEVTISAATILKVSVKETCIPISIVDLIILIKSLCLDH